MNSPKFQELVAKLREIFQIDRPELDFGIYRILNARAGEINDYLETRLAEKVQAALSSENEAQREQVARELKEKETQYQADGINPDTVPKVQELRARLKDAATGSSEHENAVFSHLLTFFSRYYEQGDFISQRRYKGDTYAIPYAGEEVLLHWANKDQYYTKSGENFSNYSFKLEDGRTVHFRLAAADTAKDNRKDNDKERRFILAQQRTVIRLDDSGEEYEETILPVEEVFSVQQNSFQSPVFSVQSENLKLKTENSNDLVIRFEYVPQPKGTNQAKLVVDAVATILDDKIVRSRWLALGNRAPTEKSPQRTLLEKHLTTYTTKNTADYFIHKDLGGFLRRELDFYIKNEVMHLDDVQNASAFADIEKSLRMIQCLRAIALELITFLAQLEDFQKKLWLKKKFVISSHYCITLDRVPEDLYPEIVTNERQWTQWKQLGVWDGDAPGTLEDLKAGQYRVVDTGLFPATFKAQLLGNVSDLDTSTDGLLVHGDNFQAMNFLSERYREQVRCVYIDPPYNTDGDGFCYKDNYQSSSWCSMMFDRLNQSKALIRGDGTITSAIGREELLHLLELMDDVYGLNNRIADLVWEKGRKNDAKYFSLGHDYMLVYGKNTDLLKAQDTAWREEKPGSAEILAEYNRLKQTHGDDYQAIQLGIRTFYQSLDKDHPALKHRRYNRVDSNGLWRDDNISWPGGNGPRYDVIHPETGLPCKVPDSGWRFANPAKFQLYLDHNFIEFRADHINPPMLKRYLNYVPMDFDPDVKRRSTDAEEESSNVQVMPSVFYKGQQPTVVALRNIMGADIFQNPKEPSVISRLFNYMGTDNSLFMDYFAGSGTTGHAVINLNRQDNGKRKFILVEQGEYFDTVLKPRIQKIVYSADWKDGKPVASTENLKLKTENPYNSISHCFKVIKLESYEDTLNNLQLRRTSAQGDLLNTLPQEVRDDYLLNYLLDVESRGSLLSVDDFKKPFDYALNVAVDSAGAFEPRKVDLVETFNFLIGLRVKHIDAQPARGFVTVTGTLPSGESCLVLWRDCDVLDYEGIAELCDKLAINPADNKFDVVYLNGDHNIPTVLTQTEEEGGVTRVLKLRQIEPEFLERMFSVEDV